MPINGTPHAVDAMLRRTEAQVEWKESGWLHLAALGCAWLRYGDVDKC
jgi:hypothetical protein